MFFNYTFRQYLTNPKELANDLQTSKMRGFGIRFIIVFLLGILLFGVRSWWGMNTEALTPLMTESMTDYTIARYVSLVSALCWSFIYISFHLLGITYLLSRFTAIPFKKLLPIQLFVTSALLVEKALVFLVFAMKGATANMSFLSLGPLAATFLDHTYLIFFFNQLTLTTVLIIILQYRFISSFAEHLNRKKLLWGLIGLHLVMAIITTSVGYIPLESLLEKFTGGGGIE